MEDNQPLNPFQTVDNNPPAEESSSANEPVLDLESQTTDPLPESLPDQRPPVHSKKGYIIGGLLIIFLAAAMFFGARLLKPTQDNVLGDSGPGLKMMVGKGGGAGAAKSVRLNMTPAKELPQDKPATNGLFVRREDQSIFIGTGNVQMMVRKSSSSSSADPGDVSSKYDGPVVEVVVNHQTKIYQDITEMTPPEDASGGEVTVQQVVKEGSLDDLGPNMLVTVWGDKQGDRFIAKVISFR